jgi:hypothetical protein
MNRRRIALLSVAIGLGVVILAVALYRGMTKTPAPVATATQITIPSATPQSTPTANPKSDLQVELDVFSGVPNPTWRLTPEEISLLTLKIGGLTQTSQSVERPDTLGYRGFNVVISGAQTNIVQTIRAYHGVVEVADAQGVITYLDPQRTVELWLLASAKPPLDPSLAGEMTSEIMKK